MSFLGGEFCKDSRTLHVVNLTPVVEEVLAGSSVQHGKARNTIVGLGAVEDVHRCPESYYMLGKGMEGSAKGGLHALQAQEYIS